MFNIHLPSKNIYLNFLTILYLINFFILRISDCLTVMYFSAQTCHQLRIQSQVDSEIEFKLYLQNLGIYSLKPDTVIKIINKRIGFN